jgi:hypothetical protein
MQNLLQFYIFFAVPYAKNVTAAKNSINDKYHGTFFCYKLQQLAAVIMARDSIPGSRGGRGDFLWVYPASCTMGTESLSRRYSGWGVALGTRPLLALLL